MTQSERSGGGALQVGDLRLLEDGGERVGALDSDIIPPKTTSKGRGGDSGRASVSIYVGADTIKRTLSAAVRTAGGLLE